MTFRVDFQAGQRRQWRMVRGLVVALVTACVLVLSVEVWLYGVLDDRVDSARQTLSEQRRILDASPLGDLDLVGLQQQADGINRVIGLRGAPLSEVLQAVGDSIPVNVRLSSLQYDVREGAATLRALSPDVLQLSEFVSNLEQQPVIARAVVVRQETLSGPDPGHQYDIHLMAGP